MARFFASAICLLVLQTALRANDLLEKRCRAVLDEYEAIHKLLRSIHDSKSAVKALDELEYVSELPKLKGLVGERRTDKQLDWLTREFGPSVDSAKSKIAMTFLDIGHVRVDRFTNVESSTFGRRLIESFELDTALRAKNLRHACIAYNLRTGGDEWPEDLNVLVVAEVGARPLIDGGRKSLLNIWGKPFRYRLIETDVGPKPVIISEVPFPMKWTEVEYK